MTKILGFSGKKQSGKNTQANILLAYELCNLGFAARVNEEGKILIVADFDSELKEGIIDFDSRNPEVMDYFKDLWVYIKPYSCADPLKEFCINVLGLSREQCYGNDAQKNSLTGLCWADMPGVYIGKATKAIQENFIVKETPDPMTAREVLQFFGTDVCRKMRKNCWVNALLNTIEKDAPGIALVTDVRFPNEVEGIQKAGGKVIRFTRAPFENEDQHESETKLDDYTGFDAIVDNKAMTIAEQADAVMDILIEWGWYEKGSDS